MKSKTTLFILFSYIAFFFLVPKTEYLPADAGIKFLQIHDLLSTGSFAANYKGLAFDPEFDLFPVREPMAVTVENQRYYVFPYVFTLILIPFYFLFSGFGPILLSLLSGLGTILVGGKLAESLGLTQLHMAIAFCTIALPYSFLPAEMALATFAVMLVFYTIISEKAGTIAFTLLGFFLAIIGACRHELYLLCVTIPVTYVLVYRKMISIGFLVGLGLGILLFSTANYYIFGNVLGVRYYQVGFEPENSLIDAVVRFKNYYLFNWKGPGLLLTWPITIFIIPLLVRWRTQDRSVQFILVNLLSFLAIIPASVTNDDGSILGPRFLSALIVPLFLLGTYGLYTLKGDFYRRNREKIKKILFAWSAVLMMGAIVILIFFNRTSQKMNEFTAQNSKGEWVILENEILYSFALPLFDRVVFGIPFAKEKSKMKMLLNDHGPKTITRICDQGCHFHMEETEYTKVDSNRYRGIIVENFVRR